jgi:hypothetical protein
MSYYKLVDCNSCVSKLSSCKTMLFINLLKTNIIPSTVSFVLYKIFEIINLAAIK